MDGDFLDPIIGEQVEAGVKAEFFDNRLLLSGAVYRINQVNRSQPDPDNEGFFIATGEVLSKGVELEARKVPADASEDIDAMLKKAKSELASAQK